MGHEERTSQQQEKTSLIEHVHNLQASLLRTEIEGLRVDTDYLQGLGVKLKHRIDELGPQMRSCVKDEVEIIELEAWQKEINKRKSDKGRAAVERPVFNFGASGQLASLLYSELNLPVQRNGKTKAISTDFDSLEKIKEMHPVVGLIQESREVSKVYDTYVMGTLDRMDSGRIYPQFRVNGTKGSRISHSNPNLGQMPKSGGVKGIYVPDEGMLFSELDYSQLEVCIEAHFTQDKNLLDIVMNNASKHDITAHNLKIERDLAKTLNFAMQYWCSHFRVAKILGCSTSEAQYIWNKYWETYSGTAKLKKETDSRIDRGLPLVDLFGRQRRFVVRSRSSWDGDYRSGYNFLIQSSGGQLMNNAFYKMDQRLRREGLGKGVLTVHDSALISSTSYTVGMAADLAEGYMVMEGVLARLTVPLKVSKKVGMSRWGE